MYELNNICLFIVFQSAADEGEAKVKELITAVEELQKLLHQATGAQEQLENKVQELETNHSHKEQDLSKPIVLSVFMSRVVTS